MKITDLLNILEETPQLIKTADTQIQLIELAGELAKLLTEQNIIATFNRSDASIDQGASIYLNTQLLIIYVYQDGYMRKAKLNLSTLEYSDDTFQLDPKTAYRLLLETQQSNLIIHG